MDLNKRLWATKYTEDIPRVPMFHLSNRAKAEMEAIEMYRSEI